MWWRIKHGFGVALLGLTLAFGVVQLPEVGQNIIPTLDPGTGSGGSGG